MSRRFQARRFSISKGRLEDVVGLTAHVHRNRADGTWCGALNPRPVGEPAPERCGICGEPYTVES